MPLSPGQILNNRYRIVKLLGEGGFGAVYRAWDINLERPRALKENLDTSPDAQRQFKREAQILSDLTHPNLPKVIDHFNILGQGQYLVMEYIDGQDLQSMSDNCLMSKPAEILPANQVVAWVIQVCEALEYLHRQNPPVIHRDIKPANIKITSQGKAYLVDFGIAKLYDPSRRTTQGARSVTPGYAPFEQYGQSPTDGRSDIYALGATLYHLLTGQAPPESIDRMRGVALTPVHQLNPVISLDLEAAVLKAMAVMPEERYQSMSELARVLRASLEGKPFVAAAPAPISSASIASSSAPSLAARAPTIKAPRATRKGLPIVFIVLGALVLLGSLLFCVLQYNLFGLSPALPAATLTVISASPTAITRPATRVPTQPARIYPSLTVREPDRATQEALVAILISQAKHFKGSPDAPVMMIEISDFQCPF